MKKKLSLNSFKVNSFVTELKTPEKVDIKGAVANSCLRQSCAITGTVGGLDDCHVEPLK